MARVGTLSIQSLTTRKFTSFEAGIAFHPQSDLEEPEKLRVIVEYLEARVSPLSEVEREGLVQFQLEF